MKRLIDLSELIYLAYVAEEHNISMKEFSKFLAEYPDFSVYNLVNCSECKHYDAKNSGFCKYWGNHNHLPIGYCEFGNDTKKIM